MSKERFMQLEEYLKALDEATMELNSAKKVDYSKLITSLTRQLMMMTNNNITSYIKGVIEKRKLSYMQYSLLVEIVKIVENNKKQDITMLLQYVEDTTGAKQYGIKEIELLDNGNNIKRQLINLFNNLELFEVIAVTRILATFIEE